nr:transposase [Sphingobium sp. BHU LFT2]
MPCWQRAAFPGSSPPACGVATKLKRSKHHEWNQPINRVRGRIEKIFGTWKRCYGLRRMRWRGLAKAAVQVRLTAIAENLKRTMNILSVPA